MTQSLFKGPVCSHGWVLHSHWDHLISMHGSWKPYRANFLFGQFFRRQSACKFIIFSFLAVKLSDTQSEKIYEEYVGDYEQYGREYAEYVKVQREVFKDIKDCKIQGDEWWVVNGDGYRPNLNPNLIFGAKVHSLLPKLLRYRTSMAPYRHGDGIEDEVYEQYDEDYEAYITNFANNSKPSSESIVQLTLFFTSWSAICLPLG